MPCDAAIVAPPRHLPTTIDVRLTGATIISRRKPSSRSHTSDAALIIAVNSTATQRTPGNMNVLRSTPLVEAAESDCRPEPSTNRKSSGWISHVMTCARLPAKRIRSRCQTVFTARASERHVRSGTRTATMSAMTALIASPPRSRASWPGCDRPGRRSPHLGSSCPCSA